ncbi:MAG: hypothetical protein AUJ24_02140 [Parcubacteria group bacterium CG1_02_36_42]|nr:MAG: hypothetical protein AUJ24_02140 [Parcubacteria group bacterium CG1_02_36_42]
MRIIKKLASFILILLIVLAYFYSYPPLPFLENFWRARIWQKPEIPLYPPKFLWNFGLPTEISEKFEWARQGIQEARAA